MKYVLSVIVSLITCVSTIITTEYVKCVDVINEPTVVETTTVEHTTVETTIEETTTETTTTTTTTTTTKKINQYTDDELYLMAHLIYAEYSDSNNVRMQRYIGSVALNRVKSDRYPNTLYGVIYQSGQYACTWDGNFNKTPDEKTWETAKDILEHGSYLDDSVVYQAEFRQGSGVYCVIGNMYFCYE